MKGCLRVFTLIIKLDCANFSMDLEFVSLEILNKESLTASIRFSIKHFPLVIKTEKNGFHFQKVFHITDKFTANFILYPLGYDGIGKHISMLFSLTSTTGHEFNGNIKFSTLTKDDKKDFTTNGFWSVAEGPENKVLLDAKYLIGGTLRLQADLNLNYRFIDDYEIRSARSYLREALKCRFFGDVVFKVQNDFLYNLHWETLCKYYQSMRTSTSNSVDQNNKPIYTLARTDPYYFESVVVDCYMNEAKYGRAMRG